MYDLSSLEQESHKCYCKACTNVVAYPDEPRCFGCTPPYRLCECGCGCDDR